MSDRLRRQYPAFLIEDSGEDAACRAPIDFGLSELFHPDKGRARPTGQQTKDAKAICERCRYLDPCREWAIVTRQDHGVWGGTTARERELIWRARDKEAKTA